MRHNIVLKKQKDVFFYKINQIAIKIILKIDFDSYQVSSFLYIYLH